jgi:hypothetical protein
VESELESFFESTRRTALVAEQHKSDDGHRPVLCRQGGAPLGEASERWPENNTVSLFPVLSIYTPELPFVPRFLSEFEYWVIFIEPEIFEQSAEDGSLVVRKYQCIADLVPMSPPEPWMREALYLDFHATEDYPARDALTNALANRPDLVEFYRERADSFAERYPCHAGIKIGGYPYLIQRTAFLLESLEPDYQIQLDMTELYMHGDSGIGYVYGGLSTIHWETM